MLSAWESLYRSILSFTHWVWGDTDEAFQRGMCNVFSALKKMKKSHFANAAERAPHAYGKNRVPYSYFQMERFHGYRGTLRCSVGDDRLWQNPRCISKPDRESFPFRRRDAPHSPKLFLGKCWECASSLQFQWQKCFWPTRRLERHWALWRKRKRWIHKDRKEEEEKWEDETRQKEKRVK